jgi:phosphatidylinositol alpha-mannosyltransferase
MKIGLVFDDSLDRPDGIQQYVRAIGGWLTAQGHEVHYLVGETKAIDLATIHSLSKNIQVSYNGNRLSIPLPANSRTIRQLLDAEQFDILHVMVPYSPFMAAKVIRNAPRRTVVVGTFHILPQTWLVRWSTHALGWWLRRSLKRFDAMFAVSPAAKTFAEQAFRLRDVSVLPNVTAVKEFSVAQPFEHYDGEVPTVMFLGRLVPRKGCSTLLTAVHKLKQAGVWPLRIVICGKGHQDEALQAQARQLGIADNVEFTGFISEADKPRYVASADIMVFPSLGGESFGIVLLEAMASGRPVVLAAANPGYASVMEPRPELLFKPGDSQALADRLKHYLADEAERYSIVRWQSEYVQQFDTDIVGRKLEQIYTAQLQKKQSA